MPIYNYALVITGKVDAPHDANAKYQVLMGVTLTARLLQTPHSIAIQLSQEEEAVTEPPTPIDPQRIKTPRPEGGSD